MQAGNSKQVRNVVKGVFKAENMVPYRTWSDSGRGKHSKDKLNVSWFVGVEVVQILPKVNAALRAAGYSNVATSTQDIYLRVQAPRG
jgi:hypothetical protein